MGRQPVLIVVTWAALALWALLFRYLDGIVFVVARDLDAARVAIATATSTDPGHDFVVVANYPWLLGLMGLLAALAALLPVVVAWRWWAEVAARPFPGPAAAALVWALFAAVDIATRPWGQAGSGVALDAHLAAAGLVLAALGAALRLRALAHRLQRTG